MYVVGGAVRDAIGGVKPKDFDVATDAVPEEVEHILKSEGIHAFPKGEKFGVISAIINQKEFEIATFRSESYEGGDGRRPTKVGYTDLETDAKRRDLTINALYYDIESRTIIDLVGGYEDIKNRRIRPVGNVYERFREDHLRVLRMIRFAHRFGSKIDPESEKAIYEFNTLPGISAERIQEEFVKGLVSAKRPELFLQDYEKYGLLNHIFKGVVLNKKFIPGLNNPKIVIANLLIQNSPETAEKVLKNNLKFSRKFCLIVSYLISINLFFRDFDKNLFNPKTERKKFEKLFSYREKLSSGSGLDDINSSEIIEWSNLNHLDSNVIRIFLEFIPPFAAVDFPDFQGEELGWKIAIANMEKYISLI